MFSIVCLWKRETSMALEGVVNAIEYIEILKDHEHEFFFCFSLVHNLRTLYISLVVHLMLITQHLCKYRAME